MTRRDAAVAFLREVAAGRAREAFAKHVAPGFRHHNPHFPAGADALMRAMADAAKRNPGLQVEVQRTLEDGDLVAVHSRIRMHAGDRDHATVHLFRFEDGRIAELWDIGQDAPDASPNQDGMF